MIFNVIYVKYIENYCVFFNVKQGNMCFIRYNRKNILIDCGSTTKNLSYNVLDNFLTSKAIKNIARRLEGEDVKLLSFEKKRLSKKRYR